MSDEVDQNNLKPQSQRMNQFILFSMICYLDKSSVFTIVILFNASLYEIYRPHRNRVHASLSTYILPPTYVDRWVFECLAYHYVQAIWHRLPIDILFVNTSIPESLLFLH